MRVLIVNAYLRNTGDAALSSVLISELKKVWPAVEITVSSVEEPKEWAYFEECPNIGSIRLYAGMINGGKLQRILRKVLALGVELLWGHLPKSLRTKVTKQMPSMVRQELEALETADLVISTAGGYLNGSDSLAGNLSVRYILLPLKLANTINKTVILAPQSYGAFGNRIQNKNVSQVLKKTRAVMTRESKSYDLLKSLGIPEAILVRSVDIAFAFDPIWSKRKSSSYRRPIKIGVTTRSWSSPEKQAAYEVALVDFILAIQKQHDAEVTFISHVTKDVYSDDGSYIDHRIARRASDAGAKVRVIETMRDQHAMKKLYNELDYLVGTRFHSVIFALTAGVPAMAIEYQHKTSGIMQDLGLDKWVINFEDVTSKKLLEMFDQLVKEEDSYLKSLKKVVPSYIKEAGQTGEIIKSRYENYTESKKAPVKPHQPAQQYHYADTDKQLPRN